VAEKSLFAAQTRVGWIPATKARMRVEDISATSIQLAARQEKAQTKKGGATGTALLHSSTRKALRRLRAAVPW
jgi:hypothetical protein